MLVNKYRIVGDVVYISLTRGQETMIDSADLEKVLEIRWHAYHVGRGKYYAQARVEGKTVLMHRFILDTPQDEHVIHLNHDTLDNRKSNLQNVSNALSRGKTKTPRQFHIDGDVVYLQLTRGQETMIDSADLEKVLQHHWYATPHTMGGYYASTREHKTTLYLHRFLLDAPAGMYVDHLNHDTLDNRRSNLKLCTNQENNENRNGAYNTSKTGVRGVSVHNVAPNKGIRQHRNPNPSGKLYVFRCHCVTCKLTKYFPYTEEGLEAARALSEAHYAAMKTNRQGA